MERFTDVRNYPSERTLFQYEIDALMTVMHEILTHLGNRLNNGTILLTGQKKGENELCIMEANLKGGIFWVKHSADFNWTSDRLAEESIEVAAEWPRNLSYKYDADPSYFGEMPSGFYDDDLLSVMVLNTTFGRFLMSVYLAEPIATARSVSLGCQMEGCYLMKAAAVALGIMRPEDLVLQESVKGLQRSVDSLGWIVKDEVEYMFRFCHLPALATWKKWHDAEGGKGKPYFQEWHPSL